MLKARWVSQALKIARAEGITRPGYQYMLIKQKNYVEKVTKLSLRMTVQEQYIKSIKILY